MNLSELTDGQEGIIVKVRGHGAFRRRILEMGFVKGKRVEVIKNAPLKDPIEYRLMNYLVSLRRSEAALIEVVTEEDVKAVQNFYGTSPDEILTSTAVNKRKVINACMVGNPNCGKTTLFNSISGSHEHVGNYSGVTVDVKTSTFEYKGYTFNLSDLPGTYSLSAYSPEELFVRDHISNELPDVIINVVDASNLERNLYLTTQLIHMDVKVVAALNMFDDLQRSGNRFNYDQFGRMIGIPFIPTVGSKRRGVNELFDKVIDVYEDRAPESRSIRINLGDALESAISKIEGCIRECPELAVRINPRFLAIKLLERDSVYRQYISKQNYNDILYEVKKQTDKIEQHQKEDVETAITDSRYGFITGALKETYRENPIKRRQTTEMIDNIITHKLFGFPIFFFFMWLMFQTTFTLGQYPMDWIESGVSALSGWLSTAMADGSFKDLIIDGIIGGVGGVIVFLPNILILFFFISFMEDTGYMARAAFIMDKVMHKIGLHGKSFIPMVMGFGCNVPAIMATRTIEDRNSRLLTILINPLMSCSARLPVYILFISAFFPDYSGTLLFVLYGSGIALAVAVARLFKRFFFNRNDVPFVMELPPYRIPTLRTTMRHMWHKGRQYLRKMGGIIMVASIIIWFLGYFPRQSSNSVLYEATMAKVAMQYDSLIAKASLKQKVELETIKDGKLADIRYTAHAEQQKESYIGSVGHAIEPLIRPLGFDWKMGISLVSGIAAKEIVVSTMSVIYQSGQDDDEANNHRLIQNMQNDAYADGSPVFTPLKALSFLLFTLIYFPCIAAITAVKKESGSWKWALFIIFYTTALAWIVSFAVFQIGSIFI
ncbi:MAG: ferrous iron transport protein B [Cytophagaceae bacterium]|jgi:ferrous iron transport protein B|nr:ferrous iron transport protein B [Cytophagaceae bacterium]